MNVRRQIEPIRFFALLVTVLAGWGATAFGAGQGSATHPPAATVAASQESPLACDRLALDPAQRSRHFEELGPALRSSRKAVRELSDGYEFEFSPDPKTIAMVAEWAAGERLCCPFFDIQLRLEKEHGPLWLRLTGRNGTKDFIKVDGAAWIRQ